jgi:vacuolar protein-sorting-associated protein 4
MSDNQFLPQAIELVSQAIAADNSGDFEKALNLYKRSLDYFMTGLK